METEGIEQEKVDEEAEKKRLYDRIEEVGQQETFGGNRNVNGNTLLVPHCGCKTGYVTDKLGFIVTYCFTYHNISYSGISIFIKDN